MSILDKFRSPKFDDINPGLNKEELGDWLINQKIDDLFDFMAHRLMEKGRPIAVTIMYLDMKFVVTCEKVTDFEEEL
ncbi:hypothetical protein [Methanobrevibacter sp.]|uniref:hypothetical protein n=1 Tax=Methanobrevibacter sp. TaxID=66852 RepID=UPI003870BF69